MSQAGKVVGSLFVAGVAFSCGYLLKAMKERECTKGVSSSSAELNRLNTCYDMLTKWMMNEREGTQIVTYLKKKQIQSVGIYGHGKIGILLYQTLKEQGMPVKYFSDQMTRKKYRGIDGVDCIPVTDMKEIPVDAIIITPCWDAKEIVSAIEPVLKKSSFYVKYIFPLNELLYEI